MEFGTRIKKYREHINLSQEELANKIYVSRQTISNWENDKCYPDINSLKLLSSIFDTSIDDLIEEDIERMKKQVNESERKEYSMLSAFFSVGFLFMITCAYPCVRFAGIAGIIILIVISSITLFIGIKIESIYKKNDCRTFKEIVTYLDGTSLSAKEQIEEKAKRPYQKFLLGLGSGFIAIVIFIVLDMIFQ